MHGAQKKVRLALNREAFQFHDQNAAQKPVFVVTKAFRTP